MRLLLVSALLALAFVPTPAQAHDCDVTDHRCFTACVVHQVTTSDACVVNTPLPSLEPCGADEVGVIVGLDERSARVCAPRLDVDTASCPSGETGIIVLVEGRPVTVCADP